MRWQIIRKWPPSGFNRQEPPPPPRPLPPMCVCDLQVHKEHLDSSSLSSASLGLPALNHLALDIWSTRADGYAATADDPGMPQYEVSEAWA